VPIAGLTQDEFELLEDGKPVSVSQVTSSINSRVKIAVVLVIDASGSMKGKPFQDARDAANAFLDGLEPSDEVAIIIFANKVDLGEPFPKLAPDMEADFTTDKGGLKNLLILSEAVEGARTPLYDAAFKAIKMTVRQPVGRRAVILFTDGNEKREDEKASVLEADDPIAEATKYGIPVFTIGLGPKADTEYLQRVAVVTGGTYAYAEKSEELANLFQDIGDRLKQQYTLEWESNTAVDYADHEGLVRVKTSMGDAEATFSFDATPAGVWIRQLYLKEGTEKRPLEDGQEVKKVVIVEPEVYARDGISKVEYYVDDTLVWTATASPFLFNWDTGQAGEGDHALTVKAYDNALLPNVGEISVSLTVRVPPPALPAWVLAVAFVAVVAVGAGLILIRRRRPRTCPTCGRVMDPSWSECLFCASEGTTEIGPEIPSGEEFEPITGIERSLEPSTDVMRGVERPMAPAETVSLRPEPQPLAWLIVEEGERVGKQFRLHEGDTSIGRAGDSDIIVSDPTVSRQHAKVKLEGKAFYIYDLGATNPTIVNDRVITRHRLDEGDRIRIGDTVLVFKRV